jgi:hypothetical protein
MRSGGDVPDWDNAERRESDEDAAWRDLIARFDAPLAAEHPVPWPTREDVTAEAREAPEADAASKPDGPGGAAGGHGGPEAGGADGKHERRVPDEGREGHAGPAAAGDRRAAGDTGPDGPAAGPAADGLPGEPGPDGPPGSNDPDGPAGTGGPDGPASGLNGLAGGSHGRPGLTPDRGLNGLSGEAGLNGLAGGSHGRSGLGGERLPAGPHDDQRETRNRTAGRHGRRAHGRAHDPEVIEVPRTIRKPARDDEEHYVPPPPPPLPKLDPVAKGAWVALFGGPGYLVLATVVGWTVTGLAAFCAVAAFVTGFALLVLRMHDSGPGGPNDGDDGAVV